MAFVNQAWSMPSAFSRGNHLVVTIVMCRLISVRYMHKSQRTALSFSYRSDGNIFRVELYPGVVCKNITIRAAKRVWYKDSFQLSIQLAVGVFVTDAHELRCGPPRGLHTRKICIRNARIMVSYTNVNLWTHLCIFSASESKGKSLPLVY